MTAPGAIRCLAIVSATILLSACSSSSRPPPITSAASAAPLASSTPVPSSPSATIRPSTGPTTLVPANPPRTSPARPPSAASLCPLPATGFDCDLQRRIVAVRSYLAGRPGTVGIVLRDRQTGAVWRNEYAATLVWTASTIKLAMTVDLFTRSRAGLITLTSTDRAQIQAMLHSSDDDAADALWFRYAGADHLTYNDRFPAYGMTSLQPQRGFTQYYPYWGFQKCAPDDLDRLIQYVLGRLNATDRAYIVGQLQNVAADQQWGVWGAGTAARPGNKDGWSEEQGGWVINSVGFVGPAQRFTLAIMNSLNGQGGYDEGTTTDSHVAQLLFAGRF